MCSFMRWDNLTHQMVPWFEPWSGEDRGGKSQRISGQTFSTLSSSRLMRHWQSYSRPTTVVVLLESEVGEGTAGDVRAVSEASNDAELNSCQSTFVCVKWKCSILQLLSVVFHGLSFFAASKRFGLVLVLISGLTVLREFQKLGLCRSWSWSGLGLSCGRS